MSNATKARDKGLPSRFQNGDVISFCRDDKVKEKHRMLVEVVGTCFTLDGIFYDVWPLDADGEYLGNGPMLMVDSCFLFQVVPSNIH